MITKYIGSVREFIDCESIALVNVVNGITLVESEIPKYSPANIYFGRVKIVNRDSNGEFIAHFTREDQVGFVVNYVIMYNSMGNPIGFTNLTQDINLYKYNIESITVSFDFTIINKISNISVDINYTAHEVLTSHRAAHTNLFDGKKGAVTKSDISIKEREGFSNNYLHVFRDKSIVYRYSGKLSKGNSFFDHENLILRKDILDNSKFVEIVNTSKGKAIIFVYDDKIKIISDNVNSNYFVTVPSRLDVGSNVIIPKYSGGERKILLVEDLINMTEHPLQTSNYTESGVLEPKDMDISGMFTAKNPVDKSISIYRLEDSMVISGDKDLNSTLRMFGIPKFYSEKLIYYSPKGMMFTAKLDSDNKILTVSYFTISLPWKSTNKGVVPRYSDGDSESDELSKLLISVCKGTDISDIIFLSKDLFIVNNSELSYKDFYDMNKVKYDNESQDVLAKYPYDPKTVDEHVYFISDYEYRRNRVNNK